MSKPRRKYIDSKPTEDWHFQDEIATKRDQEEDRRRKAQEFVDAEKRVPPSVRARAEAFEHGHGVGRSPERRRMDRIEVVRRLIAQQERMGWVDPRYERELEDLECQDGDG